MYDHIIKNGIVIDFQTMQTSQRNICIKDGFIAPPDEGSEARFIIDASGKYVLPGLVDEHVHLNYNNSNIGANADLLCIPMGVTTAVDAGTSGWTNFEGFYRYNIIRYTTSVLAYIHVSPYGVHNGGLQRDEDHNPADFNETEIIKLAVKYPEVIRGLKVRMCRATLGDFGIKPLLRTIEIAKNVEAARGFPCIVDVHYDDLPDNVTLQAILDALRTGDILSHVMQTHRETIFNKDNKVRSILRQARDRGIWMDNCHGRVHWSFKNLRNAYSDDFFPDIISSDIVRNSMYVKPGCSLIHALCVNSAAGMKELDILKAVTYTPAKALGILDRAGTLEVGKPADICLMDVQKTSEVYYDWWGGSCQGNKVFVPLMTLKDGNIVYRQSFF